MLSFVFLRYLLDDYEAAAKKELGSDYPKVKIDEAEGAKKTPLGIWYEQKKRGVAVCFAPTSSELCQFAAMARLGNRAARIAIASTARPSLRVPR